MQQVKPVGLYLEKMTHCVHQQMHQVMSSYTVCDNKTIEETMKRCWDKNQYLLCPHTAVAATYHYQHPTSG